ncbi:hypothetical protein [Mycobacterium sp. URHB0021]
MTDAITVVGEPELIMHRLVVEACWRARGAAKSQVIRVSGLGLTNAVLDSGVVAD